MERKIAELMRRHGLRRGRYLGMLKTGSQAVMTATMADARRLLSLAAADPARERALRQALAACSRAIDARLVALHRWGVFAPHSLDQQSLNQRLPKISGYLARPASPAA